MINKSVYAFSILMMELLYNVACVCVCLKSYENKMPSQGYKDLTMLALWGHLDSLDLNKNKKH